MSRPPQFALTIAWDEDVDLPSLVGPFESEAEAIDWAERSVPNGVATVARMGYPYMQARVVRGAPDVPTRA